MASTRHPASMETMMNIFRVDDMTCGHCVGTITAAVKKLDSDAEVRIDLATHRVEIQSSRADGEALRASIAGAGYTPVAVAGNTASSAVASSTKRSGCCCV